MDLSWIKTIAPMIGTALGGPLGGAAASFIAGKLGIADSTIEAVTDVLNSGKMTPEQISAVKLAEIDFQKFLKDHDIKMEDIAAKDRDSARTMQRETRSYMPATMTVLITVGYFGILGFMLADPDKIKESGPLLMLLGALATSFGTVIAFWFGTTANSGAKDRVIANSVPVK